MRKRENLILIAAILIAVLARVAAAFYLGNRVVDLPGTADQVSYHALALRVLGGHGFTFGKAWWPATAANAPTAHWSFLYTFYLVAVYALFGPNPLVARLIQSVLAGVFQPLLAYLIARHIFGRVVGLATAVLTALYAYFVYYAATLMTESFYITAILASFYIAMLVVAPKTMETEKKTNLKLALGLGLTLAVAVLLRQLFLLFIPFLFLWVLLAGREKLAPLFISSAVIVLLILPFTVFNYVRFGRFVLLNTNAGYAFFWGNHPIYGTHFQSILPSGQYYDLIPPALRNLDEAALDQALLKRGVQFVLNDPQRYLLLSVSRIPDYFMFWPSSDSSMISNISRVASFGLLWPFMLYGILLSFLKAKPFRLQPPSPLILLYLFILIYTAIHVLTWTLIRYRLPVDAILLVFAGYALVNLAEKVPVLRQLIRPIA